MNSPATKYSSGGWTFPGEGCPTQAVLPLVGLAAEKVIRDRYNGSNR
ncbi:MAG: hypothetical protein ACQESR_13260 [Planctomycetota bacterium]